VTDDKGKVVHWGIETNSPGRIARNGWSRSSVRKGDHVTLIIVAAKNGSPVGYIGSGDPGTKLIFDDGRVLVFTEKE
jgi:hypothetical protein